MLKTSCSAFFQVGMLVDLNAESLVGFVRIRTNAIFAVLMDPPNDSVFSSLISESLIAILCCFRKIFIRFKLIFGDIF